TTAPSPAAAAARRRLPPCPRAGRPAGPAGGAAARPSPVVAQTRQPAQGGRRASAGAPLEAWLAVARALVTALAQPRALVTALAQPAGMVLAPRRSRAPRRGMVLA